MSNTRKPRADSKLKNLAESDQETLWLLMHPTDSTVPAYTLEAAQVYIQEEHKFSVALSTLSDWHSWYALKRRLEARQNLADQLKLELAQNPDISEAQIRQAGQRLFMAEGIIEKDARVFADMVKIGQNETRLKQNDRKIGLQKEVVEMDKRRLALLEAKAAFADAVKTAAENSTGGITAEQMKEIERKLKLL